MLHVGNTTTGGDAGLGLGGQTTTAIGSGTQTAISSGTGTQQSLAVGNNANAASFSSGRRLKQAFASAGDATALAGNTGAYAGTGTGTGFSGLDLGSALGSQANAFTTNTLPIGMSLVQLLTPSTWPKCNR